MSTRREFLRSAIFSGPVLWLSLSGCAKFEYNGQSAGFQELGQRYMVTKVRIRTNGNVVYVEKLPHEPYTRTVMPDKNIEYAGRFRYRISPIDMCKNKKSTKKAKAKNIPDTSGGSCKQPPPEDKHWEDIRYGTVTLRKKGIFEF